VTVTSRCQHAAVKATATLDRVIDPQGLLKVAQPFLGLSQRRLKHLDNDKTAIAKVETDKVGSEGRNNRQGGNRQDGQRSNRPQQKSPLMEETWARVIDHDLVDNVIVAISEGKMLLCRLEPKAGIEPPLDHLSVSTLAPMRQSGSKSSACSA